MPQSFLSLRNNSVLHGALETQVGTDRQYQPPLTSQTRLGGLARGHSGSAWKASRQKDVYGSVLNKCLVQVQYVKPLGPCCLFYLCQTDLC